MSAKKYSLGIVGRKAGMSRMFTEDGKSIPVTLIEATPNRITQVKTVETDGYSAVQVTAGVKRASLLNKPEAGHLAKAKVEAGRGLWELRVADEKIGDFQVGGEIRADIFEVGQVVDVQGVTKGKGFQGTIKRWNFTMGDATHGNSLSHRSPGSIGQRQTPGRVFPGKKMSGHMGAETQTTQNLGTRRKAPPDVSRRSSGRARPCRATFPCLAKTRRILPLISLVPRPGNTLGREESNILTGAGGNAQAPKPPFRGPGGSRRQPSPGPTPKPLEPSGGSH